MTSRPAPHERGPSLESQPRGAAPESVEAPRTTPYSPSRTGYKSLGFEDSDEDWLERVRSSVLLPELF